MDFTDLIPGEMTQHDEPDWEPLLELVDADLASWFMWMHEVMLEDGTRVQAYKHYATRHYVHLAGDGRAFVYVGWLEGPSGYREVPRASVLMTALGEWERLLPQPEDPAATRRSIARAMSAALRRDGLLRVPDVALIMASVSPHLGSEVGVRQLNNQLSRYVRAAADGQEVVITMHGRPVARMVPMDVDPLGDLRTAGLVQDPTGDWTPTWAQREPASSPLDDLLDEQRR